jgi:ATP-dependent DNA helicase RecG
MGSFQPVSGIRGVGPKRAAVLEAAGIRSVEDLYNYFPRRYLDRRQIRKIADLCEGEAATVAGNIVEAAFQRGARGRARFRVLLSDGSGLLELTWFQGVRYFSKNIRKGDTVAVHGKVAFFGSRPGMQHPEYDRLENRSDSPGMDGPGDDELFMTGRIIPLYPATEAMKSAGLHSRALRIIIAHALEDFPPDSSEHLCAGMVAEYGLMPLPHAYREIHGPTSAENLDRARYRLKWNELFLTQLGFAMRRHRYQEELAAVRFDHSGVRTASLHEKLPFTMTTAQKNAVREIYRDLRSGRPMHRLLQGDVGSGKTLVASFAMTLAADNGLQAAFMAPTEILAFQHYLGMRTLMQPLGLRVEVLTGKQERKSRQDILDGLAGGEVDVLVGTHAIIEENVSFRRLGLVIVDEQHRFGVFQRKALRDKALSPHVLLMTATPIPRTLTMGIYGDLDVTVIDELPEGRTPVVTRLCNEKALSGVYRHVRQEVSRGRQVYIVYPLIEESEKMDLKAATGSFAALRSEVFPDLSLGLIHGHLSPAEKESVMKRFRSGEIDVLVGTTVIEVGVDVPNATVMVIEHAERFGISQLHQLRGRVGRGNHRSICFLVYSRLTPEANERLRALASTTDGFRLSETDLKLRGAGNLLGKEQSGMATGLRIADLLTDHDIMLSARKAAVDLVEQDGSLEHPVHAGIRKHLERLYGDRGFLADIG